MFTFAVVKKQNRDIEIPEGAEEVLLHACCAPCSSAIVEWMLAHEVRPTIFYFNPNIWPREEYEIRKEESKRHAESLGLRWIDGDYDHERWLEAVRGLEGEPERGGRCLQCFAYRLKVAALFTFVKLSSAIHRYPATKATTIQIVNVDMFSFSLLNTYWLQRYEKTS